MSDYYLKYLYREHARLEAELEKESSRKRPDQVQIARLKKLKLAVKDQIAQAETEEDQASVAA